MSDTGAVEIRVGALGIILDVLDEMLVEEGLNPLHRIRDAGSWIGNQGWNGLRGDPVPGTHNKSLDNDARERRRTKSARYRQNRIARGEDNKRRGNRA